VEEVEVSTMSVSRRARSSPRRPQGWVSGAGKSAIHARGDNSASSCCIATRKHHGGIKFSTAKTLSIHDLNVLAVWPCAPGLGQKLHLWWRRLIDLVHRSGGAVGVRFVADGVWGCKGLGHTNAHHQFCVILCHCLLRGLGFEQKLRQQQQVW
jgi:hypothetical protein